MHRKLLPRIGNVLFVGESKGASESGGGIVDLV
jgi:hypothetical protein